MRNDLTGQQFGYLTVLERGENNYRGEVTWNCKCKCGNVVNVKYWNLKTGAVKSCGCYKTRHSVENVVGKRFNYLTVVGIGHRVYRKNGNSVIYYRCKCDCGNYTDVSIGDLKKGRIKACGCKRDEYFEKVATMGGESRTTLGSRWRSMKDRCYNPKNVAYKDYGGRGITVCDEWKNDFLSFKKWALSNGFSEDLTIDRIDVNGNYEPSNCRWVTFAVQSRNKRNNHYVFYKGKKMILTDAANTIGISPSALGRRLKKEKTNDVSLVLQTAKEKTT